MERIKTLETRDMCESAKNGGCGECLPVRLQDKLRRGQPEMRERREIKKGAAFGRPFLCQEDLNGTPISVKRL